MTFLLTGVDSGHDRAHALTDTLLVASLDRLTNKAVMLSIPRDISNFPLYSGGTFRGKINSLMSTAGNDPKRYPDGPVLTLTREIGYLIGVPINYYAAINLDGFQKMVDLVGGVDVDNPKVINDPRYDWFDGTSGFTLSPGVHHLNGRNALAYVRSRQGVGDSDFTRAARQQQVLVALRAKLGTAGLLEKLPDLLKVAGQTIRTDFPPGQVRDYLVLASGVSDKAIDRHVLGPPYAIHPPTEQHRWRLHADLQPQEAGRPVDEGVRRRQRLQERSRRIGSGRSEVGEAPSTSDGACRWCDPVGSWPDG